MKTGTTDEHADFLGADTMPLALGCDCDTAAIQAGTALHFRLHAPSPQEAEAALKPNGHQG